MSETARQRESRIWHREPVLPAESLACTCGGQLEFFPTRRADTACAHFRCALCRALFFLIGHALLRCEDPNHSRAWPGADLLGTRAKPGAKAVPA